MKKIGLVVLPLMLVLVMGVFVGCKAKYSNDYDESMLSLDFADDSLIVMLTDAASNSAKDYTIKDFPEVKLVSIEEIGGPPKMFKLTLKEPSKVNVLIAVKRLENRKDIKYAGPNYYGGADGQPFLPPPEI